jgi:hypothetical protein
MLHIISFVATCFINESFQEWLKINKICTTFFDKTDDRTWEKKFKNYNLEIMEGVFPQPIKNIRSEKVKIHQIHQIKHFQIMSYWVYMINVVSLERKSMVLFLLWVYLSIDWLLLFPPTLWVCTCASDDGDCACAIPIYISFVWFCFQV